MNFVSREWPNLIGCNFGDGDGLSVESGKLYHEVLAAFVHMDDCADIACGKAVLRQVNSQCDRIEFANHVAKG